MKYLAYPTYKASGIPSLASIPQHWNVTRLKTAARYWVSNVDKVPAAGELQVRLCNYTDVYNHERITLDLDLMDGTATPDEVRRFGLRIADVVITKDSEEWTDIAVPALVVDTSPNLVCGYHLAIVRPDTRRLFGSFLLRALQSSGVNHQFQVAANGVTRYGLPKNAIGDAWIPLPPTDEQRTIADFLDRVTARIDRLVETKRAVIAKLKEKRTALISQTVTNGLHPRATMKHSQAEWLGVIPKHWTVKRAKILFREIDHRSTSGDEELLTVSHITGVTPRSEKNVTMFEPETHEGYKVCATGDLVINTMWAWMGALGVSGCNGMVSPAYNVYRPRADGLLPGYLDYLSRIPTLVQEFTRYSKGVWTSRLRLYPEQFFGILLPVPPRDEQVAIADFLDREIGRIKGMIAKIETAIDRLREYRATLITAAVTGKIDVREVA